MLHSIFYLLCSSSGTRPVERVREREASEAYCFLDSADLAILCQSCCIKNTQRCALVAGVRERERERGVLWCWIGRQGGLRPTELQFCTCCKKQQEEGEEEEKADGSVG